MAAAEVARAPLILFAPGAGAGSNSPWMQAWRDRLSAIASVEMFDYPYRLAGRKAPDKLPVLVAAHKAALAAARARHPAATATVLMGKSMGGRIGCHVATEATADIDADIDGVVCLGYPLRGTSGAMRDEVLLALRIPVLFVQGTRDPLCRLDDLAAVRVRMNAPHDLFVVEGGNHSLEVPRGRPPGRQPQEAADARVLQAIVAFITRIGEGTPGAVGGKVDRK